MPIKRFVNHPRECVSDGLQGLLWTNPDLCLVGHDPEINIVARANWKKDRVAVLIAGGSGHEPADAAFVGVGLITAAVVGQIFTPPCPEAVFRALLEIAGPAGCLVIMRNHFSTMLAVKDAIRGAVDHPQWPQGAQVRIVSTADDIATSRKDASTRKADFKRARGVAGIALVMKVAGAAAEAGLPLEQVYAEASSLAQVVRTQGVCFTSGNVPGRPNPRPIPPDEMEIGCGVHGELGRARVKANTTAKEIIAIMVSELKDLVPPNVSLCALLNNLGSVPPLEMAILAKEVMCSDLGKRIKLFVGPGKLVTSLDANGISLSIAPLDSTRIERLCAPAACQAWIPAVVPLEPQRMTCPLASHPEERVQFAPAAHETVDRIIVTVCEGLQAAEHDLNMLDANYKNGDCGRNLAHGARLLFERYKTWPRDRPGLLCVCLSRLLRHVEGALSSMFATFFLKASKGLNEKASWSDAGLVEAFQQALAEVQVAGEFTEGMRTFADALGPALRVSDKGLGAMSRAALKGARATAFMPGAVGRAAHTMSELRKGFPDTGAIAVAYIFALIATPPHGHIRQLAVDEDFANDMELGDVIGKGSYGIVHAAAERETGRVFAVKVSGRHKESGVRSFAGLDFLDKQHMSNWLFTSKPHIVKVYDAFVSDKSVFLVMDKLHGPDVSNWLSDASHLTEKRVAHIASQMLQAVCAIHGCGLVHRDLKLANFVFADANAFEVTLVDVIGTISFHADEATEHLGRKLICGTGLYMSPEAVLGDSSPPVDMWAVGVMLHVMLSRDYPFKAGSLRDLHNLQQREIDLTREPWPSISEDAKVLARALLSGEPAARPTAFEACDFRWIAECDRLPDDQPLPLERRFMACEGLSTVAMRTYEHESYEQQAVVKTLYLVRHGEAMHNIEERRAKLEALTALRQRGESPTSAIAKAEAERARTKVLEDEAFRDAPLSNEGKVMALNTQAEVNELLRQGFPGPSRVLVSPLERTLQTAALVFPGHPDTVVVESLRERRTGLPCDERKRAEEVAMRKTFNYMCFDNLIGLDDVNPFFQMVTADGCPEDKHELRGRTHTFLQDVAKERCDVVAVVTHKGFLRELERGPLGRTDAAEFDNCELRVYDVVIPSEGGDPVGKLRYCRRT